jgi:hypothetical protein
VRRRLLLVGAAALTGALILAGCGQQGGLTLARQACVHVNRSVHDFTLSTRPGLSLPASTRLHQSADLELRQALPLAAAANSADGTWNSLMTTISEGATVDESHLVPALKAQCNMADTNINVNPAGSPANVNPEGSAGS